MTHTMIVAGLAVLAVALAAVTIVEADDVLPAPLAATYVAACRPYYALGFQVYVQTNYTFDPVGEAIVTTVAQHSDAACAAAYTSLIVTSGTYAVGSTALANITGAASVGNATAVVALNISVTSITVETPDPLAVGVIEHNCPGATGVQPNTPYDIFPGGCPALGIGNASACAVQYDILQAAYNNTVLYFGHRADATVPPCEPADRLAVIDTTREACDGPCPALPAANATAPPTVFAASQLAAAVGGALASLVVLVVGFGTWTWWSARRLQRALRRMPDEPWTALMAKARNTRVLAFRDVTYRIGNRTVLGELGGVSHCSSPGTLLAILGSSGAGKTTLLDILACRAKRGLVSGDILLGQHALTKRRFKHLAGYVDQEETLLPRLTARETIQYAARLRLPGSVSAATVAARVRALLGALRISHIADQQVGGRGGRGISGGERRRVAIACELVTLPAVLYMDEPTSGLDSHSAMVVMSAVRALAETAGTIVVCSIHQPRSNLFALFDSALLLAHGNLLYAGPVAAVVPYFEAIGYPCPANYNPADYVVDVAAGVFPGTAMGSTVERASGAAFFAAAVPAARPASGEAFGAGDAAADPGASSGSDTELAIELGQRLAASPRSDSVAAAAPDGTRTGRVDDGRLVGEDKTTDLHAHEASLAVAFRGSALAAEMQEKVKAAFVAAHPEETMSQRTADDGDAASSKLKWDIHKFTLLTSRTALTMQREPLLLIAHYLMAALLGLLLGGLFWQVDYSLSGIQNRLGYIFFTLAIFMFSAIASMELFAAERLQFAIERSNGFYGVSAYFGSKVMLDLVLLKALPAILFASVSYYMVGLIDEPGAFGRFVLGVVLFNMTAGTFNMMMGALVHDRGVAAMLVSLLNLFNMLFSGFLLNKDVIPPVLSWIPYLSYFNYGFEALAVNVASNLTISDTVGGISFTINSDSILAIFGYDVNNYWRDIGCLAAFFVGFLVLAFVAVKIFVKDRR